jgi:hypothetical protein
MPGKPQPCHDTNPTIPFKGNNLCVITASNVPAVQHAFKHQYGKMILGYPLEKMIGQAKKLLLNEKLTLDYITSRNWVYQQVGVD